MIGRLSPSKNTRLTADNLYLNSYLIDRLAWPHTHVTKVYVVPTYPS